MSTALEWLSNYVWAVALFIVLAYLLLVIYQKKSIRRQSPKLKFSAALLLMLLPLLLFFYIKGSAQEVSEINQIDGINYSPTSNKVVALITYSKENGDYEDAVISVSLEEYNIDYFYSLDGFERSPGYANDAVYIYDWSRDRLRAISLENFDQLDLPRELVRNKNDQIIVGNYIFNDNFLETTNAMYDLETMERNEIPSDLISYVIDDHRWHYFTIAQQNNRIEKLLSMDSLSDYNQYFSKILNDESMASEHKNAERGLYYSDTDSISFLGEVQNILLRAGLQREFKRDVPSMDEHEIIGIEDNGTIYSLGIQNGQTLVLKQDSNQQLTQESIQLSLDDFEFASTHLNDRFYIMTKQGLFELMKDDFNLNLIITFEDIL